jgi:AraC-like DNA-binding protein
MNYTSIDTTFVDNTPFYQNEKLDPSFPFRIQDSTWRGFHYHWHEVLEILYIMRGQISIYHEGHVYEAAQGDIVIINPCDVHGLFGGSQDDTTMIIQIGLELFDQTLVELRDQLFNKLVFDRRLFIRPGDGALYDRLKTLLMTIRTEYLDKKEGYRLALRAKIFELALVFLREIPERTMTADEIARHRNNHQILERIFSYIYSNADNPDITLDSAAQACSLSKFYFTRFFKKHTGQTFHDFLARLRISAAQGYLIGSDLPITEIAYRCGFANLKTFNRLFKTYLSVSPTIYRSGKNNPHGKRAVQAWTPMSSTNY